MEAVLNGFSFALLLTSLFVLRFRGWAHRGQVVAYFGFFLTLEITTSHFFLPPGAMGPAVGYVCLGLSPPVWIAAYLVRRHEILYGEPEDN